MDSSLVQSIQKLYCVDDTDYQEYYRLEKLKRVLQEQLETIEHRQQQVSNKILSAWKRTGKQRTQVGLFGTLFIKREFIVLPLQDKETCVQRLIKCDMGHLVYRDYDAKELRRELRKEDCIPEDLQDCFSLYKKNHLACRISK